MNLNERLESVEKGMKAVNDALEPLMQSRPPSSDVLSETTIILRKHTTLTADWDAVREESEVLREELKEDKWLTVFRTVTDQADGMMSSLEKAVNRCQVRILIGYANSSADGTTSRNSFGKSTNVVRQIPKPTCILRCQSLIPITTRSVWKYLVRYSNLTKPRRSAHLLPVSVHLLITRVTDIIYLQHQRFSLL